MYKSANTFQTSLEDCQLRETFDTPRSTKGIVY